MAFTEVQLNAMDKLINGYTDEEEIYHEGLENKVNTITRVRNQIAGLVDEMHNGFSSNAELMTVINTAKSRAKAAADELSVLLS